MPDIQWHRWQIDNQIQAKLAFCKLADGSGLKFSPEPHWPCSLCQTEDACLGPMAFYRSQHSVVLKLCHRCTEAKGSEFTAQLTLRPHDYSLLNSHLMPYRCKYPRICQLCGRMQDKPYIYEIADIDSFHAGWWSAVLLYVCDECYCRSRQAGKASPAQTLASPKEAHNDSTDQYL